MSDRVETPSIFATAIYGGFPGELKHATNANRLPPHVETVTLSLVVHSDGSGFINVFRGSKQKASARIPLPPGAAIGLRDDLFAPKPPRRKRA